MSETIDDPLYAGQAQAIRAARPQFAQLITEVTGWRGVDNLADWMVRLLIANQGTSGLDEPRMPCEGNHTPPSVPEYAEILTWSLYLSLDDPTLQGYVEAHRQNLRERFGI